ncbi:MAG TPA: cytochrome c oxidase subunit II [Alphaproteobacteria bacterium]|nr:cytochrome c oxidase subunit II [Alphaproteobacteria bacterium]
MKTRLAALATLVLGFAGFAGSGAYAAEPQPWEMGMQPAASLVADRIHSFNSLLLWIITLITLLVLGLLVYVMWRFRASRNPVPTKTSHNTLIEVIWTVVPIMILVIIAIPSFKLIYYADVTPKADLTVKATGHQWYWSYDYPDSKVSFDSQIIDDDSLKPGQIRLLSVDNPLVVPVHTYIRVLVTSDDVIHAWVVPALGMQINGVPGRLNEIWMNIEKEGTYYGQCTQLCGVNHGFMPIEVKAVSKEAFAQWLAGQQKASSNAKPAAGAQLAQAEARR